MPPFTPLIINGQSVSSSTGSQYEIKNPFSDKVVGLAASASSTDCKAAITSAYNAFKTWEQSSLSTRRDVLLRAADLVQTDRYKNLIIQAIKEETAASDEMCIFNWVTSAGFLKASASLTRDLGGDRFSSDRLPGGWVVTEKKPLGVICATICELLQEAGLPDGVFNFLSIFAQDTPERTKEIIAHPLVEDYGMYRVGRIIAMEAAKHLKPCVPELGGKAPAVNHAESVLGLVREAQKAGAQLLVSHRTLKKERIMLARRSQTPFLLCIFVECSLAMKPLPSIPSNKDDQADIIPRVIVQPKTKNSNIISSSFDVPMEPKEEKQGMGETSGGVLVV
ncbi:hypothetical protein MPER_12541, partial [Moniliophthora perniciosa FA553]